MNNLEQEFQKLFAEVSTIETTARATRESIIARGGHIAEKLFPNRVTMQDIETILGIPEEFREKPESSSIPTQNPESTEDATPASEPIMTKVSELDSEPENKELEKWSDEWLKKQSLQGNNQEEFFIDIQNDTVDSVPRKTLLVISKQTGICTMINFETFKKEIEANKGIWSIKPPSETTN